MPWLMKAEPDSRIEKGKDVKFSVDDFEKLGTSQWDGVRNHEAKKIMKERMKLGDRVFFYHSNCKVPGVYAIAEVSREGYPDYTAWDPEHPYYDEKTNKEKPTWFMVDVTFESRLPHPPTLALVKHLSTLPSSPLSYLTEDDLNAIRSMALVNRGRLSVQPVTEAAWDAIVKLGNKGGWEDLLPRKTKRKKGNDKADENGDEIKAEVDEVKTERKSPVKKRRKGKANEADEAAIKEEQGMDEGLKVKPDMVDIVVSIEAMESSKLHVGIEATSTAQTDAQPDTRRRSQRGK